MVARIASFNMGDVSVSSSAVHSFSTSSLNASFSGFYLLDNAAHSNSNATYGFHTLNSLSWGNPAAHFIVLTFSTYSKQHGMAAWMAPHPPLTAPGIQSAVWTCKCPTHFRVGIRKEDGRGWITNRFAGLLAMPPSLVEGFHGQAYLLKQAA